jgi:hypothetical protein
MMQLVGVVVLGFALLAGWDSCVAPSSCSAGTLAVDVVIGAIGVVMLCGGFVAGARKAKLERPVLLGFAAFVVGWGGGVLVSILAGRRPLVGIVFLGTVFVLVAERRGPALGATAAATLVMALKDLSSRGTSSGMVAVTIIVLVALVAFVPQGQPSSRAEERTTT